MVGNWGACAWCLSTTTLISDGHGRSEMLDISKELKLAPALLQTAELNHSYRFASA
jgi:hypothetical protein